MGADDVAKGLKRNDAELAVAALLKLPVHERDAHLAAVGELFRAAVAEAHQRGDWSRLGFWVARVAKEERLGGDATSADAAKCWWALLWGAVRTKDLPRAALAWRHLEPQAQAQAPALGRLVGAFVESGATAVPAEAAPVAPRVDPRLGHEPQSQRRPRPPAPTSVSQVETAVLTLCAQHPWGVFAETMEAWCQKAPAELAAPLRVLGVRLGVRELLIRAEKHHADVSPAVLVATLLRDAGAPLEVADDVLVAFRVVASSVGPEPLATEAAARPFCLLGAATARFPAHREIVSRAVEGQLFAKGAARSGLRLVETLLGATGGSATPSLALAVKALKLWPLVNDEAFAPEWLAQAFARLSAERTALTRFLGDLDTKQRLAFFDAVGELLPAEVGEAIVDGAWDGSDGPVRHALGQLVADLVSHVNSDAITSARLRELTRDGPGPDFESFLEEVEDEFESAELCPKALKLFERHEAQLLTLDREYLEMALEREQTLEDARKKVERFVAGKGAVALVEAAATATNAGWTELGFEVESRLVRDYASDAKALAEAFHAAHRLGAPRMVLFRLSLALLKAYEAAPATGDSVVRAVEAARVVVTPKIKPKKSATKKAKKSKAKKKPSKPKKSPAKPEQDDLPF